MKFLFRDPKNHPMYGVDRSGEKRVLFGKKLSIETKEKISKSKRGKPIHTQKHKEY